MVFSTFLDDEAARLARTWQYAGYRTIAVGVSPSPVSGLLPPRNRTAYRIVRMERVDRLAALAASGVEVVPWEPDAPPSGRPEVVLAARARARRVGR